MRFKLRWVHLVIWLVLTVAITFVLFAFGDAIGEILKQLNIPIDLTDKTPALLVALALLGAFWAAVVTLVIAIFQTVMSGFNRISDQHESMRKHFERMDR